MQARIGDVELREGRAGVTQPGVLAQPVLPVGAQGCLGMKRGPWFLWRVKRGQRMWPSPISPISLAWQRKTLKGIRDPVYSQVIRPRVPPGCRIWAAHTFQELVTRGQLRK